MGSRQRALGAACSRSGQIDFGGTLLHLVLDDIAGNFSSSAEDLAYLQMMFDEEQRLLKSGEITSDFTLIVARNRID